MAEFAMKQLVAEAGRAEEFEIASAAVSREELGNPVYPPASRLLAAHGIDCSKKRARQVSLSDAEHYDFLLVMDDSNLRLMASFFDETAMKKVRLLGDYTQEKGEIDDPWYTGDFEEAWRKICAGCRGLLQELC